MTGRAGFESNVDDCCMHAMVGMRRNRRREVRREDSFRAVRIAVIRSVLSVKSNVFGLRVAFTIAAIHLPRRSPREIIEKCLAVVKTEEA